MHKFHFYFNALKIFFIICLIFTPIHVAADDTCMFTVNAGDVPPSIVLLLDNGAEMEQIYWRTGYDNNVDYTPASTVFSNTGGYAVKKSGNKYYLYPIQNDLLLGSCGIEADSNGNPTWTINSNTITLPAVPSSSVDADNIKDNAERFRYSTNYLNWLFYSGLYTGNGSDLPVKSRFYYAKKAIMQVAKLTENKVKFGIYNFSNSTGGSQVQPLGLVVNLPLAANPANNILNANFINNINNMSTVTYSPLAEGLASVGGYYGSQSSHVVDNYCQKLFSIIITPGVSSEDQAAAAQSSPASLSDYDGDLEGNSLTISGVSYTIPVNQNGSTYLDDVAYYHYTNDIVDYSPGFQRVNTYTLGFMGNNASNKFLINTSNNGNGNFNLYDETDSEYGKYHFQADDPDTLSDKLLDAINLILSETATFTAPVVPVTRTTSGDRIYMSFFKPEKGNLWTGRVEKFAIGQDSDGNSKIVDYNGLDATWPNGAMRENTVPYWSTKNWAVPGKTNYIHNQSRNIYTYLGTSDLTVTSNGFNTCNTSITNALLGNPADVTVNGTVITGRQKVINFVLGADVLDEDNDGNTTENRKIITGDILHSEPAVVAYQNAYSSNTVIYFGANDGMLHAVNDSNGSELWGFIPDDQLNRLKDMLEGSGHQYYVDSSPKIFITGNGDSVVNNGEQAILICGQRRGGSSYFALDITNPNSPLLLWTFIDADLGQSWSEPVFGKFKTSSADFTGTNAIVIGGGYDATNATGKAVFIIDITSGAILKKFYNIANMDYSIPSTVKLIDENANGFADKIYVGDLGGQMWRIGRFIAGDDTTPLPFPNLNEDISTWDGYRLFAAASAKKIFYPPSVTLERGFDMVFWGTGDRTDACNPVSSDKIYAVKDQHLFTTRSDSDLEDVTDPASPLPDMATDQGFYLNLANGEKVLAEGIVFYKTFYVTTFIPNVTDPCVPGGTGTMYALDYLTGKAKIDFDDDGTLDRTVSLGGGIPSKPVMIIPPYGPPKILITIGTTNPDINSEDTNAGILVLSPLLPSRNFFYLWWRILL